MATSIRIIAAASTALAALAACSDEGGGLRAGAQPLARLITAEAQRRALSQTTPTAEQARQAQGMCSEVLRISERGQLILDRTTPGRLLVDGTLWGRVPEEARQAIQRCDQVSRPDPRQPIAVVPGAAPE